MECLRNSDAEEIIEIATETCPGVVLVMTETVEEDVPWSRNKNSAEITDCHGEEDAVGGGLHARSAEDDDDDGVGDDGDPGQDWHHDPEQRKHELERSVRVAGVEGVAGAILYTSLNISRIIFKSEVFSRQIVLDHAVSCCLLFMLHYFAFTSKGSFPTL